MKNKKIAAIFVMLVLTVATGLVVASDKETIYVDENIEFEYGDVIYGDGDIPYIFNTNNKYKEAIDEARMTLPFEEEETENGVPPLPNPFMITYLKEGWNMMGYPNQGAIDLNLLAVVYNDTTYTWAEAWEQDIVLRFVYEWDRDLQCYYVVDEIEGGYGYWMWAYYDCELWSLY